MMGSPCLRYRGVSVAMMFERQDSLIIKVSSKPVNQIIADDEGNEFNFTRKRFKQWVLNPMQFANRFLAYIEEAIEYAKSKKFK